jgi:hypothetical protein
MFDYDAAQTELITPKITLPASSAPSTLVFDHAYAYYNDAYFDSLRVDITADCGATWTTIFHDGYEGLATAPVATAAFTPTADQWRANTIDLTAYNGSEVIIRFVAESGYGNNAYLDNVNVTTVSGVKTLDLASFTLNPNPTKDVAEVRFSLENSQEIQAAGVRRHRLARSVTRTWQPELRRPPRISRRCTAYYRLLPRGTAGRRRCSPDSVGYCEIILLHL